MQSKDSPADLQTALNGTPTPPHDCLHPDQLTMQRKYQSSALTSSNSINWKQPLPTNQAQH
jgi:hypothetical protein